MKNSVSVADDIREHGISRGAFLLEVEHADRPWPRSGYARPQGPITKLKRVYMRLDFENPAIKVRKG